MFLDAFPKISYDIAKQKYSNYQLVTNITFRFGFIKEILNNISAYYFYRIKDGERPEILAENIYNNSEAYWIILMANDMYDPQYDWPLDYKTFQKYIIKKYGSTEWAKTNYHHYEKIVRRTESLSGITTENRFWIDYNSNMEPSADSEEYTADSTEIYVDSDNNVLVTFAPYDSYITLPSEQSVEQVDMNGQTVTEIISRDAITYYDYEDQLNEKKRTIKIIKPEYYGQIMGEFNNLTNNAINPRLRRLI